MWVAGTEPGVEDDVDDPELELIATLARAAVPDGAVHVTVTAPRLLIVALRMIVPGVMIVVPLEPAVMPLTVPGLAGTVRVADCPFFTGTLKLNGEAAGFTEDGVPPETLSWISVMVPPTEVVTNPSLMRVVIVEAGSVALTWKPVSDTAPPGATDDGAVAVKLTGTGIVRTPASEQL